jgi:hypothetical protein
MFERVLYWLKNPDVLGKPTVILKSLFIKPVGVPPCSPLNVPMILLNLIDELRANALQKDDMT